MSAVRFQTHGVLNYNFYIRQFEFLEKERKGENANTFVASLGHLRAFKV